MAPSTKLVWLFLSAQAGDGRVVGISIEAIGDALDLSHRTVIQAVRALADEGRVERVRLGRYHTPTLYRVVELPRYLDKAAR